jgi:hypothetical protein
MTPIKIEITFAGLKVEGLDGDVGTTKLRAAQRGLKAVLSWVEQRLAEPERQVA